MYSVSPNLPLHPLLQALDLHLDCARLRIRRRLERLDRIFQLEPMCNQLAQLNHAALDQPNRLGPCIAVPVLELQVHLTRRQSHERDLHLVLADADDEYLAAELDGLDRAADAGFHTGALHSDSGLDALHLREDGAAEVVGRVRELDLVRCHAGHELLCKLEATLVDIRNHNGRSACSTGAQQCDEANGTGTADDDGVAEAHVCTVHARERDGQRLKHGAVLEGQVVWQLVAPHGRVREVAAQETCDGRRGEELHLLAAVVAARETRLALVADDVWLDGDAVADFEGGDGGMHSENCAGGFVAEDVCVFDDHGTDAALDVELAYGLTRRG
jgi:hypothetical protein